ncbi:CGNR zinc finger domain-containing protein [Rhizobium sp. RU36D]|uniref:CGNR zinc finger domain-containing protein n=1 Tax=Rhizobium sp. RU36D TaxID=1907415 RepID=UPI0009D7EBF9|nr:CGNR zinc finger domain-containing protein [Rhizobium sp. RU36D]SMD06744.1 Conserved protein containing a Zn-ribbon-like motif, possibly RNA-binding [Rhizobium sp. RU36D]
MSFAWTPHRFSGGALALDLANSVILRFDPARRVDRFADPDAILAFVPAAQAFCAERWLFQDMVATDAASRPRLLALREAIDVHFRRRVLGTDDRNSLSTLLDAASQALRHAPADGALEAQSAHSALRLICEPDPQRMKICGNCGWLFLDRSKNRSRTWCDMAVCGNRVKASKHYKRKRGEPEP